MEGKIFTDFNEYKSHPRAHFCVSTIRHFDDIDDLLNYGRDGELLPGQEEKAREIAQYLVRHAEEEKKDTIALISSSKKRGQQTADLIATEVQSLNEGLEVQIFYTKALNALSQGVPILPEGYQPGDQFEGYPLAQEIFNKEAFSEPPNDLYHFGDPVQLPDGSYKYPELVPYFKTYGENNRDLMTRIYTFILELAAYIEKHDTDTEIMLITHAQVYQILKNLSVIAKKIERNELSLVAGELPRACWKVYKKTHNADTQTYDPRDISIDVLKNKNLINLIKKELQYLKALA